MKIAAEKGIMINTISCSGMAQDGNMVFQEVAQATNGTFEYLTYRYAYEDGTGKKQVILNQAGKDYIVDEAYVEDEDWRSGATEMVLNEKAKESTGGYSPGAYIDYDCGDVYTCEASSSGGGTYSRTEEVNNLDSIMTHSLKEEAEKSGVVY